MVNWLIAMFLHFFIFSALPLYLHHFAWGVAFLDDFDVAERQSQGKGYEKTFSTRNCAGGSWNIALVGFFDRDDKGPGLLDFMEIIEDRNRQKPPSLWFAFLASRSRVVINIRLLILCFCNCLVFTLILLVFKKNAVGFINNVLLK